MYRQHMTRLLVCLFLMGLAAAGCTQTAAAPPPEELAAASAAATTEAAPAADLTPQQVTETFYNWYLDVIGDRSDGSFTNPLVSGLYRDSDLLTADFVTRIDETIAGFEQGGYDPILLAQDIPVRFELEEPAVSAAEATVVVLRYWGGNPDPSPMVVHLVQENGRWLINNVTPFEIPAANPPAAPETPDAVVSAFYNQYLSYIGDPATDNFHNPLVEKAYHEMPYLTDSFVQHVDDLIDFFHSEYGGAGYDPFLCAQDFPSFVAPDVTFVRNGMASVVTRSSFPNQMITVDLEPAGESWLIRNITCAHDPAGVATAFYTWYLGYIGDRSSDNFRNPLVDGAYRDHPMLADAFEQQVDETVAGFEQGGFDPFLLAQDIPQDFSVDPGAAAGTAVVHLQFGPDSVRHLLVTMDETGRFITDIAEDAGLPNTAPTAADSSTEQTETVSDAFGFSFSYPAGWVLEPQALEGPGMPDDWPVAAAWLLMPPQIAADLAAQSGPPNPEAPVIVAPFNVEVVVGDEAAVRRVYDDLATGETAVFNTYTATILRRAPGYSHVIFAHPLRPDVWLVFTDWVTEFPGREAQGTEAAPVWPQLLNSLQFHE